MSKARQVSDHELRRKCWNEVFNKPCFESTELLSPPPFTERMEAMALLSHSWGSILRVVQYKYLQEVLRSLGETGFYCSPTSDINEPGETVAWEKLNEAKGWLSHSDSIHWHCPVGMPFENYCELYSGCENRALYSDRGTWGVYADHDLYALLGGSRELIREFKKRYFLWPEAVNVFRRSWPGYRPANQIVMDFIDRLTCQL